MKLKGESGEHLATIPPYGYVKDRGGLRSSGVVDA